MEDRYVLCIDLRSFFASVECADAGLDIYEVPLVVADRSRGKGGITLAVTPYLKKMGVASRSRVYELPTDVDIIFAKPRMRRYVEVSTEIIGIYLDYVSEEDLHIYSIDEAFLDVTKYLKYYDMTVEELALDIQKTIFKRTKIHSTCGIGPNMLLAKFALDLDSKQMESGIARWTIEDLPRRLWPVEPLSKVWGIGPRLERRLNKLGIYKMYDLAHADVNMLKSEFGVYGEQLYNHAHGIDTSSMQAEKDYVPKSESIGHGQTLYYDYNGDEAKQVILELCDRVAKRMRKKQKVGTVIHLGIRYSKSMGGGGFSKQVTVPHPTDSPNEMYDACVRLFDSSYHGEPIRKVSVSMGHLTKTDVTQMDIFGKQEELDKERSLLEAMDSIHEWYGKNAILRAAHFKEGATMKERNKLIGGHKA